jgi:putative phage-type endonuclease
MANNPQDRAAWVANRRGKITASRIGLVTRRKKDGQPYAGYDDYLMDLVVERLTNQSADHFVSDAMQWGLDTEEVAAQHYAFETGRDVAFSDFVDHPNGLETGASPDRLVGADGLLEIKCPTTKTHVDFLLHGEIKEDYLWQMQWQMACTGRRWCDFMSYDPRLPVHLQSKIIRVQRDEAMIKQAMDAVYDALLIVREKEQALRALNMAEAE